MRPYLVAALAALIPCQARAQRSGLDASYGRWWPDSTAVLYSVGYHRTLLGPFDWGLGVAHVDDSRSFADRTQTGADFSLGLGRHDGRAYVAGTAGLAMRHSDGNLDASWSAGVGWAVPLFSLLSLGLELRYRTEDQDARGFWQLRPDDRRGLTLGVRLATGATPRRPRRAPTVGPPRFDPPTEGELIGLSRDTGASPAGARVAADVVRTAIDVMGSPYTWGGSDANGYDCSGLIQYAYGQHGIILPRISRDQVRMGKAVEPRLEVLRPGDILGFSVEGDRVTHVGLYLGEGQFIHSASGGVKLSSLSALDGDSQWWRRRWTMARRILQ
ncbi:MAG: C40 family peptidase [Gemmatimonadetes bacterium]|nr:C40 family peptidase [Gemmatimonadota bacterium]